MKDDNLNKLVGEYVSIVKGARSPATGMTYQNALNTFMGVISSFGEDPNKMMASKLNLEHIRIFSHYVKKYSVSTERIYMQVVKQFYHFLIAEKIIDLNQIQLREQILSMTRRGYKRLPQFSVEAIEQVINYADGLKAKMFIDDWEKLRAYRDRAFILTLADTGLRVHEACKLRRGDIDFQRRQALVIGKGNKQAVVRFSTRAIDALQEYLKLRLPLDVTFGKALTSLPVFSRHDNKIGAGLFCLSTCTGRNIVAYLVTEALGQDDQGNITPHSFRHYFVTKVLSASDNLKLAQELARHANIQVTQLYAHLSSKELDKRYRAIFD